jgi:hypothetical protein
MYLPRRLIEGGEEVFTYQPKLRVLVHRYLEERYTAVDRNQTTRLTREMLETTVS